MLILSSCSKNDDSKTDDSVTINGQSYPTAKIGSQTWTTVNYNGAGGVNYNDGANDPTVGKLYSFPEVKSISDLPDGWRIPTQDDVRKLMLNIGAKEIQSDRDFEYEDAVPLQKIMSTTGWTNTSFVGNNTTGLNLIPTGYLFVGTEREFSDKGILASFWTSTTNKLVAGSSSSGTIYSYDPVYFEVSTHVNDEISGNTTDGLIGYLYDTTARGDGITDRVAEMRSIRFVKDN